jgi:deaminated glutathione amidase
MSRIGVVALQLELRAEDNLDRIVAEIEAAKRRLPWGELFVLPELCTYGPSLRNAQPPGSRTESVYRDVGRRLGIWLVPGSLLEQRGENVALVIDPQGEVVGRYAKLFPFLPYERGVKGGDSFCTFRISEAGCFGLSICYDLWFPETSRTLAWLGAEVILAPTLTNPREPEGSPTAPSSRILRRSCPSLSGAWSRSLPPANVRSGQYECLLWHTTNVSQESTAVVSAKARQISD